MDTWVIVTIASVAIGFILFGTAFFGFMRKWRPGIIWALCIGAFLFATIIPVIVALGYASTSPV
nr:hypothetical protein [Corynebacterium lactis]